MIGFNPIKGFIKTSILYLTKKVSFEINDIGKIVEYENEYFEVFRRVIIKTKKPSKAIFCIRFTPKDMTVEENIRFSKKPMRIFMGFSGFLNKYWCVNRKTNECLGIYEWDSIDNAKKYSKSIAVRFMTNRSIEDAVSFKIYEVKNQLPYCIENK
jgi:hypothetical protein